MVRSLQYLAVRDVRWTEVSAPTVVDGRDALVRPVASAMCDLDRRIVTGSTAFNGPFAIGHEAVAVVLSVGEEAAATGLQAGRLVLVPLTPSCGTCARCLAGRTSTCERLPLGAAFGVPSQAQLGGLFDDVVRVPFADTSLVTLPDGLDPWLAAAAADSMTDAYRLVVHALHASPGADVLVLNGTPTLGSFVVMWARALGAGRIVYCDRSSQRAARAMGLGASEVRVGDVPDRVEGDFPVVVDCSGDLERGPRCAVRSAAPGGVCSIGSVYFGDVSVPYFEAYLKGVDIRIGLPHARHHAPSVLRMLAEGAVDPSPVLAAPLPYEQAPDVLLDPPQTKPVFIR